MQFAPECLRLGVMLLAMTFVGADDSKKSDKDKHHVHGTISKIDSQQHKISVKTVDKQGKTNEQSFQLADDTKFLNAAGKDAKLSAFETGDYVCMTEQDGKVTKLRKNAQAKITKINEQARTITVKMTDKDGKETEKTFRLIEDTEYVDSTGRVAVLDIFQSGDDILFIDAEGTIETMKKDDHSKKTADKDDKNQK